MSLRRVALAVCVVILVASPLATQPAVHGLYHCATLHGDTIVFAAEGDCWQVPVTGGHARRLTSHPDVESHPVISPDGTTLTFSARYERQTEVYTLSLATFNRRDAQLEAAIAHLKQKIAEDPRDVPKPPAYPRVAFP
jgi:tricorn protease